MFNFPAFAVRPASTAYASQFRHTLRTYYPDVVFLKPHTGMHLDLASMGIDVMYTHEDAVKAEDSAKYPLRDFNCTSTVLKLADARPSFTVIRTLRQKRLLPATIPRHYGSLIWYRLPTIASIILRHSMGGIKLHLFWSLTALRTALPKRISPSCRMLYSMQRREHTMRANVHMDSVRQKMVSCYATSSPA